MTKRSVIFVLGLLAALVTLGACDLTSTEQPAATCYQTGRC